MSVQQLLKAGQLDEAIQALSAELRDNPGDAKRRTSLFELLCFAGDFARAEKQLDILASDSREAEMGGLIYRSALHAEKIRHEMFEKGENPRPEKGNGDSASAAAGTLNGKSFEVLSDADPRVGAHLEIFAAGSYMWLPFSLIASVQIPPPKRLRDLLWAPALVKPSAAFQGRELGEVLLPVLTPFSWKHPDANVRLGRSTVWEENAAGDAIPLGQKMLMADEEEIPLLEVRSIEFAAAKAAP
jgi:type VI secretion system protein ImpE